MALAGVKGRLRIRNLLARQCLAEFLGVFVLMVGRVMGEGNGVGKSFGCLLVFLSLPLGVLLPSFLFSPLQSRIPLLLPQLYSFAFPFHPPSFLSFPSTSPISSPVPLAAFLLSVLIPQSYS